MVKKIYVISVVAPDHPKQYVKLNDDGSSVGVDSPYAATPIGNKFVANRVKEAIEPAVKRLNKDIQINVEVIK